ncbi:putative NAD(P)H-binding [Lyophyllum shimeji]|uniref:NAD(P)H-binding n=1 Tax=Lyophyllum shimeji TaxID=47721 RepID=A0A9P3PNZ9_LYOSH|nr:putative NAD(P)H-binding [Lyophyllum shimeji]
MRSPDKDTGAELKSLDPSRVLVLRVDLQDLSSIAPAVDAAILKFQKIDLLLNNAGFGEAGAFEGTSRERIQAQFDVNLFGLMDVTRAILPHFRANGGGGIINISSGSGFYALPLISIYTASKFALEGFTESLAFELASQNTFVKSVVPHGHVGATNFTFEPRAEHTGTTVETPDSYKPYVQRTIEAFGKRFEAWSITAQRVAEVVFEAATDGAAKLRYPVNGTDTADFRKARFEPKSDEEYVATMRSLFP